MKTTEMDVKKQVLESLIKMMEGTSLKSMVKKPEPSLNELAGCEDEEELEEGDAPKIKGLSISVIDSKEEDEEDPLKAKLKKLFSKE